MSLSRGVVRVVGEEEASLIAVLLLLDVTGDKPENTPDEVWVSLAPLAVPWLRRLLLLSTGAAGQRASGFHWRSGDEQAWRGGCTQFINGPRIPSTKFRTRCCGGRAPFVDDSTAAELPSSSPSFAVTRISSLTRISSSSSSPPPPPSALSLLSPPQVKSVPQSSGFDALFPNGAQARLRKSGNSRRDAPRRGSSDCTTMFVV